MSTPRRRLLARAAREHRRELLIVAAAAAIACWYVVSWATFSPRDRSIRDFSDTYTAATIIRSGNAAGIYEWHLLAKVGDRLMAPDHLELPYLETPYAALLALPLTSLPLPDAFVVWSAGQVGLVILAVVVAVRAAQPRTKPSALAVVAIAGIALATPAANNLLAVGTSSGFNALGVAMAFRCWRRGSYASGAIWLVATAALAKPHLAIGMLAFMLGWGKRRAIAGALAAGLAAAAAFVALVGASGLQAFLVDVPKANTVWSARGEASLFALPSMWLNDNLVAYLLGIAAGCAALVLCFAVGRQVRRDRTLLGGGLATACLLSLLASPHAFLYDLVMVAPAIAWLLVELDLFAQRPQRAWSSPWLVVILWLTTTWIGPLLTEPLLPLVMRVGQLGVWAAIVLAVSLWWVPQQMRFAMRGGSAGTTRGRVTLPDASH
jgi:Glycosyltransferase family 87